jgi:hypothetical protein
MKPIEDRERIVAVGRCGRSDDQVRDPGGNQGGHRVGVLRIGEDQVERIH